MPGPLSPRRFRLVPAAFLLAGALAAPAATQTTDRISVDSNGDQGSATARQPSISSQGQYVVFRTSNAFDAGDKNSTSDIYLRDTRSGTTTLVSAAGGVSGNGTSLDPHVSGDGSVVVFTSGASDLVAGDLNGARDVILAARSTLQLVSVDSSGVQGNDDSHSAATSQDGSFVAFLSDATNFHAADGNGKSDVFLRDFKAGTTTCLSLNFAGTGTANGDSVDAHISDDGQAVVFTSFASNLVIPDTNNFQDVFLYTPATGLERVSETEFGVQGNAASFNPRISRNGRYVVFTSYSSNLDPSDTNLKTDVYLLDRQTGDLSRESVSSGRGQLSDHSSSHGVSNDGRYVLFECSASELPNGGAPDRQLYLRDRLQDITFPVTVSSIGSSANDTTDEAVLAADSPVVAFASQATNLVTPDQNGNTHDIFLRTPGLASWSLFGTGYPGTGGTVPDLSLLSGPVLGAQVSLLIKRSSPVASTGFFLVGTKPSSIPTSWGGTILVSFSMIQVLPLPNPNSAYSFPLDDEPSWEGADIYVQMLESDRGASDGISFSRGMKMTLGY